MSFQRLIRRRPGKMVKDMRTTMTVLYLLALILIDSLGTTHCRPIGVVCANRECVCRESYRVMDCRSQGLDHPPILDHSSQFLGDSIRQILLTGNPLRSFISNEYWLQFKKLEYVDLPNSATCIETILLDKIAFDGNVCELTPVPDFTLHESDIVSAVNPSINVPSQSISRGKDTFANITVSYLTTEGECIVLLSFSLLLHFHAVCYHCQH